LLAASTLGVVVPPVCAFFILFIFSHFFKCPGQCLTLWCTGWLRHWCAVSFVCRINCFLYPLFVLCHDYFFLDGLLGDTLAGADLIAPPNALVMTL